MDNQEKNEKYSLECIEIVKNLPSEKEILNILKHDNIWKISKNGKMDLTFVAKIIHKRIKQGKKKQRRIN